MGENSANLVTLALGKQTLSFSKTLSTLGLSSPSQGKAIFLTFQTATSR
jgi:hypothetical protein